MAVFVVITPKTHTLRDKEKLAAFLDNFDSFSRADSFIVNLLGFVIITFRIHNLQAHAVGYFKARKLIKKMNAPYETHLSFALQETEGVLMRRPKLAAASYHKCPSLSQINTLLDSEECLQAISERQLRSDRCLRPCLYFSVSVTEALRDSGGFSFLHAALHINSSFQSAL